jgi:hypothetical protein
LPQTVVGQRLAVDMKIGVSSARARGKRPHSSDSRAWSGVVADRRARGAG